MLPCDIIDMETGWNADFVIQKQRPFSIEEFRRHERVILLGQEIDIATAEDTIIAKLEWARHGQSERQLRDIAGLIQVRGATLDTDYIEHWSPSLTWWKRGRQPRQPQATIRNEKRRAS